MQAVDISLTIPVFVSFIFVDSRDRTTTITIHVDIIASDSAVGRLFVLYLSTAFNALSTVQFVNLYIKCFFHEIRGPWIGFEVDKRSK
jgi:hypothetical protein